MEAEKLAKLQEYAKQKRTESAIERVERMLSKHIDKAPKEFTEDLLILVNIAKQVRI